MCSLLLFYMFVALKAALGPIPNEQTQLAISEESIEGVWEMCSKQAIPRPFTPPYWKILPKCWEFLSKQCQYISKT